MTQDNLKNLTIDQLKNKRKWGVILLYLLIGSGLLNITVSAIQFFSGKDVPVVNFGIVAGLVPICIAIYSGKKKIDSELMERNNYGKKR